MSQTTTKIQTKFTIGDIVSLKTNYLNNVDSYQNIWLSGNPIYTTPLMVVVEVIINDTIEINEHTGKERANIDKCQYKCIYFSNKELKFKEEWFFEKELHDSAFVGKVNKQDSEDYKEIEKGSEEDKLNKSSENQAPDFKKNQRVVFKTNHLEILKRKSFLEINNKENKLKASALLTYSSPVFIISGFKKVEKKNPEIDLKTLKTVRVYPSKLVKVKFFNSEQDKFSEFLVPIEVLSTAEIDKVEVLQKISKAKDENSICVFTLELDDLITVGSVNSIHFVSDDYFIYYTNLFTQEKDSLRLSEIGVGDLLMHSTIGGEEYPKINTGEGTNPIFSIVSIYDALKDVKNTKKTTDLYSDNPLGDSLLKLNYTNRNNKLSVRYVLPYFITEINTGEVDEDGVEVKDLYIKGFCLLRNADRFFKVSRINKLSIVSEKVIVDVAKNIWKSKRDN